MKDPKLEENGLPSFDKIYKEELKTAIFTIITIFFILLAVAFFL